MIRFGLCCIFRNEPIRFRRTTAAYLSRLPRRRQLDHLSDICGHNADSLGDALEFCRRNGIGSFRINSQILPLKTHPDVGYRMEDLPGYKRIIDRFRDCGDFCRRHDIRTTFHPDQFILLSSPNPDVIKRSVADLAYQAEVAEWVGADVLTIHGGGAYGDKPGTIRRLRAAIARLPEAIQTRLALENDDRTYTPADLLPLCRDTKIPLVYDVHHHRCLPDGQSVEKTTDHAIRTWRREPLFHISSPARSENGRIERHHHEYIDPDDFPSCWLARNLTVEVEAKAKELAVNRLITALDNGRLNRSAQTRSTQARNKP